MKIFSFFLMVKKINCLIPQVSLRSINVEDFHTIESISKLLGGNLILIFKGSILMPKMTVGFYNIQEGECLIAVNPKKAKQIDYWEKTSKQRSDIMNRMTGKNVVEREKEIVRLRDISLLKMDFKPRSYRKLAGKIEQSKFNSSEIISTETVYEKPLSVCSGELPIFWQKNSCPKANIVSEQQTTLDEDITIREKVLEDN